MFAIAQVVLLAKLMLTVVIFDPRAFDTFTLPKSVAAHATSIILAALLVWLAARHGRGIFFWSATHLGAGAVLVAFAVATPLAVDPMLGLFGVFRRYLGLTQMLDNVVLYVAVGVLFRDRRSLGLLATVVFGSAVPVLVYALVQRLGFDPLRFQQASTAIPISTLGNPDLVGAYLTILGTTAIGVAFILWQSLARWRLIALAVLGASCLAGLYVTGVRAGALGVAAGWLAIVILAFRLPEQPRWRRRGVLALGALLALGVLVSPIGGRLRPDVLQSDTAVQNRVEVWRTALKAIAERPLLGLGPDNFAGFYPANRTESSAITAELENSTHDLWLYVGTSAGLVGLAALSLFVATVLWRAVRDAGRGELSALALIPLLTYLGTSLVNVNEVVLDWTFWLAAGVIASGGSVPLIARHERLVRPHPRPRLGVALLVAAFALVAFTEVPRLVASEAMLASEGYAGASRGNEALPYGQQAVAADPRRAENWSTYGTALFSAGRYAAAASAFATATALQGWQGQAWRNLAIASGAVGNPRATLAAAERAVAVDPYDSVGHALLSSVLYDQGDWARSAKEGERAFSLTVAPTPGMYFITVSAYVQLKDLDRAETLSRTAVAAYPFKPLRLQLASILSDRGKKAEALAVVDALLRQFPGDVDSIVLRGSIESKP